MSQFSVLPFFIAGRYFRAKKSPLVTLIGRVAVLSIAVSTAAMVLVLSVMNGMNRFVAERFWGVDADLRIEVAEGKFFEVGNLLETVRQTKGVKAASGVLQDQALLTYGEQNGMVRLKGVDTCFMEVSDLKAQVYSGNCNLDYTETAALVVMGGGVFAQMQIPPSHAGACLLYAVDARLLNGPFAMQQSITSFSVYPSGLFSSIPEYDNQYLFCDLAFARIVFKAPGKLSAIEVRADPSIGVKKTQENLRQILGGGFTVKDRIEQQQSMFKSMKAEKLIVISVFAFVMLIATFTMVANQMLLMYEKRRDIAILASMGMQRAHLRTVFFGNGLMVTWWGTLSGLILGSLLTFGQQYFGWVKLGGGSGNYITDVYPVYWQAGDVLLVWAVGMAIGMLASALPLRQAGAFAATASGKE